MEVGSVATDFEHRSYGETLADCQRYYFNSQGKTQGYGYQNGTTTMDMNVSLPVPMRANPSVTAHGSTYMWRQNAYQSVSNPSCTSTNWNATKNTLYLFVQGYSNATNGWVANSYFTRLEADAELQHGKYNNMDNLLQTTIRLRR